MTITELKEKAKPLGIQPSKMKKAELIRSIQTAEGHTACFGTSNGQCNNTDCCFWEDCLKADF